MLDLLSGDPACYDRTAERWARKLSCSAGTVKGEWAWERVVACRAAGAAERVAATGASNAGKRKRRR